MASFLGSVAADTPNTMKTKSLTMKRRTRLVAGLAARATATCSRGVVTEPVSPPQDDARVSLDLAKRTKAELLTLAKTHIECMTGNLTFRAPMPSAAEFKALVDDFEAAMIAAEEAREAARLATARCEATRVALEKAFLTRGGYVQLLSNGSCAAITSAGLPVRTRRN